MEIWKRAFPLTLRTSGRKRSIFFEKSWIATEKRLSRAFEQGLYSAKNVVQTSEPNRLFRWLSGTRIMGREKFCKLPRRNSRRQARE
jgi:hypothetical protein